MIKYKKNSWLENDIIQQLNRLLRICQGQKNLSL